MTDNNDFVSPFFSEEVTAPHSPYWAARRELAEAMRELQALMCTSDIDPEAAIALTARLQAEASALKACPQYHGVVTFAKESGHGSLPVANHELLSVGGHSHPAAPGLHMWHEEHETRGKVRCSWAFEGPPGHVHGGWIAAIFDHFMGMAHMRGGKPGMTGGLSVRYHAPTPIDQELSLIATTESAGERRTLVKAEMSCGDTLTASAEAMFIRPKHKIFG
jgi:acyl-coenzyme A thioesterase PaaI-like protein